MWDWWRLAIGGECGWPPLLANRIGVSEGSDEQFGALRLCIVVVMDLALSNGPSTLVIVLRTMPSPDIKVGELSEPRNLTSSLERSPP
jgi:hypothetical protein